MQNLKKFSGWLPHPVCWACQCEVGWEENKTVACVYKVMMIFLILFASIMDAEVLLLTLTGVFGNCTVVMGCRQVLSDLSGWNSRLVIDLKSLLLGGSLMTCVRSESSPKPSLKCVFIDSLGAE